MRSIEIIWTVVSVFTLFVGIVVGYFLGLNRYKTKVKPVGSLLIVENQVDGDQMILEIPDRESFELVKRRHRITLDVIKRSTK